MNIYTKVFLVALISFLLFFGAAIYTFDQHYADDQIAVTQDDLDLSVLPDNDDDLEDLQDGSKLDRLVRDVNRKNILLFGIDGVRTDTIMFVSFDLDNKLLDIVNIPRDTYHYVEGFDRSDQKKINAVYGMGNDMGGSLGLKREIENLMGVPIDNYIKVDYEAVKQIVDVVGGVEVNVPFDLDYDDSQAEPPLHIDIKAGQQTLNGENAIDYLRWRKNNDGRGAEGGDLARIKRQQDFLKTMARKTLSFDLPAVANTVFKYVQTDVTTSEVFHYATKGIGFSMDDLNMYTLPGNAEGMNGISYYMSTEAEITDLLISIYERGGE